MVFARLRRLLDWPSHFRDGDESRASRLASFPVRGHWAGMAVSGGPSLYRPMAPRQTIGMVEQHHERGPNRQPSRTEPFVETPERGEGAGQVPRHDRRQLLPTVGARDTKSLSMRQIRACARM